jgi:hypothetical protein
MDACKVCGMVKNRMDEAGSQRDAMIMIAYSLAKQESI